MFVKLLVSYVCIAFLACPARGILGQAQKVRKAHEQKLTRLGFVHGLCRNCWHRCLFHDVPSP